jgi:hypothetical protein
MEVQISKSQSNSSAKGISDEVVPLRSLINDDAPPNECPNRVDQFGLLTVDALNVIEAFYGIQNHHNTALDNRIRRLRRHNGVREEI